MAERESGGMRTLVVGLDAACPPVLRRLFDAGVTPALRAVFEDGVAGPLASQVPPWTPSAWPSLYTGVNPGKHGVYDFLAFDGYDWDVVNRSLVREHALWELCDRHGLSSVVVNVPVTHPPRPFDGALVPGYVAPEGPACHPPGLLADVREAADGYRVYPPRESRGDDERRLAWLRELARMRGAAFRYLADRFDPDLGFLQFQATDTVFHEFPGDRAAVRAVYRAVDDQVGATLAACDPDAVVVASDHGIGEYAGYEFRVNEYLRAHGLVETTRDGDGMPSWDVIARNRLQAGPGDGRDSRRPGDLARGLLASGLGLAARAGLAGRRAGRLLDRAGLAGAVARCVPTDAVRAASERVDFAASTAYARSRTECGVRLNLAGREPDGLVPADEYEWVRGEVASALEAATTPDGDPVFDAVDPREEVFCGPHLAAAPDLVTVPAGFDQYLSASLRGRVFAEPTEPWNHKLDGVVALAGDGVDPDASVAGAHLFDVAPTVLATLGLPASDRMDGDPLPAVEPAGTTAYPPFDPDPVATADDAVEARLSDLGYLE